MSVTENQLIQVIMGMARAQAEIVRGIGIANNDVQFPAKVARGFNPPRGGDLSLSDLAGQAIRLAVASPQALDSKFEDQIRQQLRQ